MHSRKRVPVSEPSHWKNVRDEERMVNQTATYLSTPCLPGSVRCSESWHRHRRWKKQVSRCRDYTRSRSAINFDKEKGSERTWLRAKTQRLGVRQPEEMNAGRIALFICAGSTHGPHMWQQTCDGLGSQFAAFVRHADASDEERNPCTGTGKFDEGCEPKEGKE